MKKLKKAILLLFLIAPALVGFAGYLLAGKNIWDAAYYAIRMYLFDADTNDNNLLVELGRWSAPIFTVSGLVIVLKSALSKVKDFFAGFASDAVAVYGDNELMDVVKKNIKHAIKVEDDDVPDVEKHIIMFSTDEKGLAFYNKNKSKMKGEIFIKLEQNESYCVALDNVKFFNPYEIISRNFWQKNDIKEVIAKGEMEIAILGSDVLSRKILTYGLLNNIYSLNQKISYKVWSENDFFEKAHSDFQTMNNDTVEYCDKKRKDKIFSLATADRIVITEKTDNEVLYEISKLTKGEIYYFDPMGTFVDIFSSGKIHTFGRFHEVITEENIRTDYLYDFAKELNYHYALKYLAKDEKPKTIEEEWEALDTFLKGSNIASVDYHKIRLIVMEETKKTTADEELAEMEHIRWSRYHYLNHWSLGANAEGGKDKVNKKHPCLKPFSELDEINKNKDKDGVNTLLSLEGLKPKTEEK